MQTGSVLPRVSGSKTVWAGEVRLVERGRLPWRIVPDESVHRLSDEVGMAVVPRVLLDHVDQDVAQAGQPVAAPLLRTALGQDRGEQVTGAGRGIPPARVQLLGRFVDGRA